MTAEAIRTAELTKRYGQLVAVDAVGFQVRPGEIYGFLGLNGAGKSTTIRMLLGMTKPTSGAAYLFGERVSPGAGPWQRVGYLVDGAHAYPGLTVRQNLELVRRLRGVRDTGVVDVQLDRLGLTRYADRRAGLLSMGNAQRLGLAKALLHRPDLLVLDEPANGLDPAGIVELRDLLSALAAAGAAILVSSHILAEVARLATRIGIVDEGVLLTELDTGDLYRADSRLRVDAHDREAAKTALSAAGLDVVAEGPEGLDVADAWALAHPDEVATLLVSAGAPPTTLHAWHEDLEAYFLRLLAEHRGRWER